jgi:hypothetical protein
MENYEPIVPLHLVNAEYDDFIGVYKNFVSADLCDEIVEKFDERLNISVSTNDVWKSDKQFAGAKLGKLGRSDTCLLLETFDKNLTEHVSQYIQACVLHYVDQYDILQREVLYSPHYKLQKTVPGGGYHVWHYEAGNIDTGTRIISWMVYLNDLPSGEGETEFFYQRRRINPSKGTIVIFPAQFTHTHRGLTVLSQDKYILTGWFYRAPKS